MMKTIAKRVLGGLKGFERGSDVVLGICVGLLGGLGVVAFIRLLNFTQQLFFGDLGGAIARSSRGN